VYILTGLSINGDKMFMQNKVLLCMDYLVHRTMCILEVCLFPIPYCYMQGDMLSLSAKRFLGYFHALLLARTDTLKSFP